MRKIKEVLRLKLDARLSHEQIAAALDLSKGVVTKYVGLAAAAGLDWAAVQSLDDVTLERRLLASPEKPRHHVQPDFGRIHHELRRKGVTLMLLWEEYRAEYAERQTYGYSQFCENYRHFAKRLKRSMRQIHRGGEKLFIDFAGPTLALADGGRAHIYVAAMGASSYTFACATERETMADWLDSTGRALAFYGGVPAKSPAGDLAEGFLVSDCGYRRISESVQVGPQSVTKKPFVLNRSAGGRGMGIESSLRSFSARHAR